MKKFEFNVFKFDNEDVIATSGSRMQNAGHFHVQGQFNNPEPTPGNEYSYSGDLWSYDNTSGKWIKMHFDDGDQGAPDLAFFVGGAPTIGNWYYCEDEGSNLYPCPDADHSYIHE